MPTLCVGAESVECCTLHVQFSCSSLDVEHSAFDVVIDRRVLGSLSVAIAECAIADGAIAECAIADFC